MKNRVFVAGVMCVACLSFTAAANRTDADLFNEARMALDKFHDCSAGAKALNEISAQGKRDPIWIYYAAKANECAGNLSQSLDYYRQYDKGSPGQREIVDKIGELSYKLRKQNEEKEAAERALRERMLQEQQARDALTQALNKFSGTWRHEEHNTSATYKGFCSARLHSNRQFYINRFAVGQIKTTGTYRIETTVQSDGNQSSSDCNDYDGVNMRRDSWRQDRSFDVTITCSDRNLDCDASMSMTKCFGNGCQYLQFDQKYYSAHIVIVGGRLSFDVASGTYLMSR